MTINERKEILSYIHELLELRDRVGVFLGSKKNSVLHDQLVQLIDSELGNFRAKAPEQV